MRRTHVRDRSPPPKMRARERGSGSLLERLRSLRSFDPVGSQRGASALTVPLASRRVPERGSLMGRFKDIAQRVRDRERLKLGSGAEATLEEEELRVGGVRGPIAVLGRRSEWQSILHDEQRWGTAQTILVEHASRGLLEEWGLSSSTSAASLGRGLVEPNLETSLVNLHGVASPTPPS
ncbi:unnamed protein product [Polarella glacialis]|uniref:Uncharacterized protein n=1 Tax=Polarella glacialis TaxID=89957 RepID=A0A813DQP2_POLGL|nr:unnamed protein product [Polarella glacialis]